MRFFVICLLILSVIGCEKEEIRKLEFRLIQTSGCNNLLGENKEKVIAEANEYRTIIADCANSGLPQIDFHDSIVLVKYEVIGCKDELHCNVYYDEINHKYSYILEIERGLCKVAAFIHIWAIVPKLDEDYAVEFSVVLI